MSSNTGISSRSCSRNTSQVWNNLPQSPLMLTFNMGLSDVMACIDTGQGVKQKIEVDGLEITFTEGPPLKKFVTPPKLSEDLAK